MLLLYASSLDSELNWHRYPYDTRTNKYAYTFEFVTYWQKDLNGSSFLDIPLDPFKCIGWLSLGSTGVIYAPHSTPFLAMTESSLIRRINHNYYNNNI